MAVIQLYHGGMRCPAELIGEAPVCPSDSPRHGARALTLEEVGELKDNFIAAAIRAQECGYDGVELHGAHGYILCQFISQKYNHRTDAYGGSLENRSRLLFEIVDGVRAACGKDFLLGVRLSPERFGMDISEIKWVCQKLIDDNQIDFLDLSVWDYKKMPEVEQYQDQSLLDHFLALDYKTVQLTIVGKIRTAADVREVLATKVDFVTVGHAGIIHHDFPTQVMLNPDFTPEPTPISPAHLIQEGVSEKFINYLRLRPGFVAE